MGKLLQCDGGVLDGFHQQCHTGGPRSALEIWRDPSGAASLANPASIGPLNQDPRLSAAPEQKNGWEEVGGLEAQQRQALQKISSKGVYWKHPTKPVSSVYILHHGGDVESDGNCLFTASKRAMSLQDPADEVRKRTVKRFLSYYNADASSRHATDALIRNLYSPDLATGWGVHLMQEVKLLAKKTQREALETSIEELVQVGVTREGAAETVYKERCISIHDGQSWAKYMSVAGNADDEHDIITLQYTQEGLLSVDENREGRAAAFGDDIAIESLATEYEREIFVVQAHGADAMVDEENCIFFLPHLPRGEIQHPPAFLFMKGTSWCGAGADHYEPLLANPAPSILQEKAAVVL